MHFLSRSDGVDTGRDDRDRRTEQSCSEHCPVPFRLARRLEHRAGDELPVAVWFRCEAATSRVYAIRDEHKPPALVVVLIVERFLIHALEVFRRRPCWRDPDRVQEPL